MSNERADHSQYVVKDAVKDKLDKYGSSLTLHELIRRKFTKQNVISIATKSSLSIARLFFLQASVIPFLRYHISNELAEIVSPFQSPVL